MLLGERVALAVSLPEKAWVWRNMPEISSFCRQQGFINEEAHKSWIKKVSLDPQSSFFTICANGPIGVCGLSNIDLRHRRAEFSIYVTPGSQGKGFGKDALVTLLRHGFNDFNLHRIYGETFEGNPALKLFESVGMKVEGVCRDDAFKNGKFINVLKIAILREEFHG